METIPNHVKNVWKIKNVPTDKIQYLLDKLSVLTDKGDRIIDFDLIIPEPRYKKDCPKNCIVNSKSHITKYKDRPWFDWYEFHTKYWGTKWGAYDGYTKVGKTYIQFVFNTAWNFPDSIFYELAKLGYDLECKWADEDYGNNCGILTYCSHTKEFTSAGTLDLKPDPTKWAKNLWDRY